MSDTVNHRGTIWVWSSVSGAGSWHFLTIDGEAGEAVAAYEAMRRLELGSGRGFGSVKVEARIGDTAWSTSVFPSQSSGSFILPLKAAVRKAEGLAQGEEIEVELQLL